MSFKGHNYGLCRKCGKFHIPSKPNLGQHPAFSDEHKKRISQARQQFELGTDELYDLYWNKELSDSKIASIFGTTRVAILQRRKRAGIPARNDSDALKGKFNPNFGKHFHFPGRKGRPGKLNSFYGKHHSLQARAEMSRKKKELCQDPEYVKKMMIATRRSPNKSEIALENILNLHFPGEWKYTGDGKDGTSIGGKVPDFININGFKAVIELFSDYWHSRPGQSSSRTALGTLKHYLNYGFRCLLLDYKDVKKPEKVTSKIAKFKRSL